MSELEATVARALGERYTIRREVGRGGMARVFLAEERHPRRQVAVKVLDPTIAATLGTERFLREVELAANLTHPHILPIHSAGEAEGLLYYTMPYVEGQSLRDRLEREPQLPVDEALEIAREVADALAHAHGLGVVHRDIKPENILLLGGHAVVADFGIARAISAAADERLTETGLALGTPAYMSPEQAAGGALDGQTDEYALACVVYEMLAGRPPFTGQTAQSVVHQHLAASPAAVTSLRPAVPGDVDEAVTRALEKSPADRYPTVARFADALRAAAHRTGPGAQRQATSTERDTGPGQAVSTGPSRRRAARAAAIVAGAAVLAMAGWLALGQLGRDAPAIRSLAVLPLANFSGHAEQEYFVDGMHDALIAEVAQIGSLVVISRQSVLRYRQSEASLGAIARELGVDALIEGSVFVAGDSVRITVQLVQAEPERHLWADSYRGSLRDALGLHGEVARAIADAVHAAVTPEVATRLARRRPVDPAAQEAYLRGVALIDAVALGGVTLPVHRDRLRAAIRRFEEAIELDPGFATAHAQLAAARHWLGSTFHESDPDTVRTYYERSKAAALQALALDENEPSAHAALGWVLWNYELDWEGAERAFRRALELDPNSQEWVYALYLRAAGRYEEAAAAFQRAELRWPHSQVVMRQAADAYFCAGWDDLAFARYEELSRLDPDNVANLRNPGLMHLRRGAPDAALAAFGRAVAASDSAPWPITWLAYGYARTGRRDEARALLSTLEQRSLPWIAPQLYLALGESDRARFRTAG